MFEITHVLSGDRAEAEDADSALLAAATLAADHAACGAAASRRGLMIHQDGRYEGALTELARRGHRETLTAGWSR